MRQPGWQDLVLHYCKQMCTVNLATVFRLHIENFIAPIKRLSHCLVSLIFRNLVFNFSANVLHGQFTFFCCTNNVLLCKCLFSFPCVLHTLHLQIAVMFIYSPYFVLNQQFLTFLCPSPFSGCIACPCSLKTTGLKNKLF